MDAADSGGQGFFRKYILGKHLMFWLFIVSYTLVHVNFEYKYWLTDERDIFGKYELAADGSEKLEVAKEVYFTKATWMFALVIMMALGLNFRTAMAFSFTLYSVELMLLFPVRTYTFLNLLLAAGLLIEQAVEYREGRPAREGEKAL